jgi:hypothetical protein
MTDTHNRFLGNRALSPETLMMGYGYDPFLSERSLKPPVFHTSTFVFRSAQDGKEFFELAYGLRQKRPNEEPGLIYSRINNPDLEMLEDRLAIWDQAEASLVFASGMAAISTTLWAYARPGSVIIHSGPVYGGTDFLLKKILPQFGVTSIGFLSDGGTRAMEEAVESARGKGPIAALYIETPANPTNGMVDLERARKIVSALRGPDGNRPVVVVDNTLLGPIYQTPLAHGADLVVTYTIRPGSRISVRAVVSRPGMGPVDVLVANAGGGRGRPVDTKASTLDPALFEDSLLEEAVSSELVSEPKFPASWEYTGYFVRRGLRVDYRAWNPQLNSTTYDPIPYASEQGIYFGLAGN